MSIQNSIYQKINKTAEKIELSKEKILLSTAKELEKVIDDELELERTCNSAMKQFDKANQAIKKAQDEVDEAISFYQEASDRAKASMKHGKIANDFAKNVRALGLNPVDVPQYAGYLVVEERASSAWNDLKDKDLIDLKYK